MTQKRHPYLRILFLFFTCAVCFSVPIAMTVYDVVPPLIDGGSSGPLFQNGIIFGPVNTDTDTDGERKVAGSPIAGQSFPVAGQEAADGGIVLHAQDEAEIGELVRLDAAESDVDGLTWQILPYTPDFEVIEEGRRAFFSSRVGGSYLFIIAGAKGGVPYLKHHTITVLGDGGGGNTGVPEKLSVKVRRWTKLVEKYDARQVHALALAGVFRKLATAEDIDVESMLDATATANSAILGGALDSWLPLLEPLGEELDILTEGGALDTREQYTDVWLQIADGIEKGI